MSPAVGVLDQPAPDKIRVLPHTQYYTQLSVTPSTVLPDPLDQFRAWFTEVVSSGAVAEAEAMSLATATSTGVPSVRTVLLKELDPRGFVFYTNYGSRKSQEMSATGHAALNFYWHEIHRVVRVVGTVEKVSREETKAYYDSRPVGSRVGAWVSPQSQVIQERELATRFAEMRARFGVTEDTKGKKADVPVPDFWGGWRVVPTEMEFWCGKPSRLHERVRYTRISGTHEWKIEQLGP
ncbi:pyridoxamine 5'-phosphate oxidase [Fistulina hepatica ATCC 64428]|uniref:pyridoxal 5'-phosphate synthase n=1 Tax=Fistulina hepatica ATCC 64428 TaxID=1128425 RepID=A0A0D7A488_9AGAR|nr:pyridoxamine 5'-phosphate oxidase [Fistulina hepatica ATCC 64428]